MIKPDECKGCPLYQPEDGRFSYPDGEGTNGVVIVTDDIGHEEAIEGKPLVKTSQGGSKFVDICNQLGVSREQFRISSIVSCQPPRDFLYGAPYEMGAIEHCNKEHFNKNVGEFHTPFEKVVVASGKVAMKTLTGLSGLEKNKEGLNDVRGYVFKSKYGWVIPTLDYEMLRKGGTLTPFAKFDLEKAIRIARGEYKKFKGGSEFIEPKYNTAPSYDDAQSFYYQVRDNKNKVLTYDIETPELAEASEEERGGFGNLDIKMIQFSLGIGEGIAFPYVDPYIGFAKKIMALGNVKANHNTWDFDNPRLKAKGFEINGIIHDTLWMFKHWQPNLERGLQKVVSLLDFPFPWKHLYGPQLAYYGCADVDAVQWIIATLPKLMKQRGIWEGYWRHVYRLNIILESASKRGVPVNEEKRQGLIGEFQEKKDILQKEMQDIFPDELKGIQPRRKDKETGEISYGYVKCPKEVKEAMGRYEVIKEKASVKGKEGILPSKGKYILDRTGIRVLHTPDGLKWGRLNEFTPSSQQLVKYLEWKQENVNTKKEANLYKVPLKLKADKKTGIRAKTTGRDELLEMWEKTEDPLLERALKYRSLDKMLTNDLPNWKPDEDGRVHCRWGYTAPTGQLNAWQPNILNASKHATPEAMLLWGDEIPPTKRFRDIIEAPSGRCFVEFDKKSFHVAMMGFIAEDKEYIRFSQLDPHSIYGSYIVGGEFDPISLSWSDKDILEASKEFKKRFKDVRQQQAKPSILGNQLGLGARKLQHQNRKYIRTIARAEELQEGLANLFPKVEKTKLKIREEAFLKQYLINNFWRIQYFFDVFQFVFNWKTRQWDRKNGDDAEKCLAFAVQSNSFGMIQEEKLEMEEIGLLERYEFINTIHDSCVFMPLLRERDRCIEDVVGVMGRACKRLVNKACPEGLVVKVEPNWGINMGKLEEVKI